MKKLILYISITLLAGAGGAAVQQRIDAHAILAAHQNEEQANGLEDECKAMLEGQKR